MPIDLTLTRVRLSTKLLGIKNHQPETRSVIDFLGARVSDRVFSAQERHEEIALTDDPASPVVGLAGGAVIIAQPATIKIIQPQLATNLLRGADNFTGPVGDFF